MVARPLSERLTANRRGELMITPEAVEHRAEIPFAYPIGPHTLRVRLRAKRGELKASTLLYADRYTTPGTESAVAMERVAVDDRFDYFQADLTLTPPRFRYAFLLDDGLKPMWYAESGLESNRPRQGFFQYPYVNEADRLAAPDWLIDSVVYQIFPERFANGERQNDPKGVRPWTDDRPTPKSFYGGDLQGIIDHLDHLEELGVNVLYLNPIFASPTNHKYDTTDYYTIDPHFGDIATFKRLVEACHAKGIRVLLDAVFNHCGYDFFAFQDVRKRGEQSPYADWFHIEAFPVRTAPRPNYETFANGIASMPKLRTGNPEVRRYLLDVARYWIETCDIDGWRIDVANEVDHEFWRHFRQVVKAAKPDAYIVGEIWHEAGPWLLGDQFDGVTNYPLRQACLDFFADGRLDAAGFAAAVSKNLMVYADPMLRASWNLLGSHDTERILTACGGDARKVALAVVFNMTWIGTPMVYYGDEIGIEGKNDPDCRRPMIWERAEWNIRLFDLHKRLIGLRLRSDALRRGNVRILHADPLTNTLAYWRGRGEQGVVVALNNSGREQTVTLDGLRPVAAWEPLVGESTAAEGADGVTIRLAPYAAGMGKAERVGPSVAPDPPK